jgi:hypothetical protein
MLWTTTRPAARGGAVNEDLLRDAVEVKLIIERGEGQPSRPSIAHWVNFFSAPSAQSWHGAHNAASWPATWRTHCWLRSRHPLSDSL